MKKIIASILVHLELLVMSLIVLVPIFWIVISSFNAGKGLASSSLIPKSLTLKNYVNLFTETNYGHWFLNSFMISSLNAVISVIIIVLTSWVFSRFDFRGKKFCLMSMLLISMFPSFLSMAAIYTLFLNLDLLNKPVALVIVYVAGAIPYNVWLMKGYLDGVSKEIDEAAYIDGCTYTQSFFKIILPMSKPMITYCAVSQFMLPWMDYILPNMLLSSDSSQTVAIGLYTMITGKENSNFTLFAAGAIIVAVPITILFIIFQKYIVEGIASGANKG